VGKTLGGVFGGVMGAVGGAVGTASNVLEQLAGLPRNTIVDVLNQPAMFAEQAAGAAELALSTPEHRQALAQFEQAREQLTDMQRQNRTAPPEYAALEQRVRQLAERTRQTAANDPWLGIPRLLQPLRMSRQELEAAWEAGRAGAYTGMNLPALAYQRILAGEEAESVLKDIASYQDPLKEMAGQAVLDPLDVLVGLPSRTIGAARNAAEAMDLYLKPLDVSDDVIVASMRSGLPVRRVAQMPKEKLATLGTGPLSTFDYINPLRRTADSRRALEMSNATEMAIMVTSDAPDDRHALPAWPSTPIPQDPRRPKTCQGPSVLGRYGRRGLAAVIEDRGGVLAS
jgi:hypothetical protein